MLNIVNVIIPKPYAKLINIYQDLEIAMEFLTSQIYYFWYVSRCKSVRDFFWNTIT